MNNNNIVIPNTLNITINTNVPGYPTLSYTSSMSLQNDSSNKHNLYFNPLYPLKKSVIDKVPEDIRISEFFNKGLFQSLINFMVIKQ